MSYRIPETMEQADAAAARLASVPGAELKMMTLVRTGADS
jgi:hypothetical protein